MWFGDSIPQMEGRINAGEGEGDVVLLQNNFFWGTLQFLPAVARTYYIARRKAVARRGRKAQKFTRIALLKIVEVW